MSETHIDAQDGHTYCGQQRAGHGVPADQATHAACQELHGATARRDAANRDR